MMFFGSIGMILILLFWSGLILGGIWLVRTVFSNSKTNQSEKWTTIQTSPLELLERRYARGEVSREEYQQIKADLT